MFMLAESRIGVASFAGLTYWAPHGLQPAVDGACRRRVPVAVVGRTRPPAYDCLSVTKCVSRDHGSAGIGEAAAGVAGGALGEG
jgi:hypothetical protein